MDRKYEILLLCHPTMTQTQVSYLADAMVNMIEYNKGSVSKSEYCGLQAVAYPIKACISAHYQIIQFAIPVDGLKVVKETLMINENIIRYRLHIINAFDHSVSPILRNAQKQDMISMNKTAELQNVKAVTADTADNPDLETDIVNITDENNAFQPEYQKEIVLDSSVNNYEQEMVDIFTTVDR